jgi:hypothetical protein
MVIRMLALRTLGKVTRYPKSLKLFLGCNDCNPGQRPSAMSVPPLTQAVLSSPRNVWVGPSLPTFLFSAALRVRHEYFNLKWFHSYCDECSYLLLTVFILIFCLIFLKILERAAALQLLWARHPCLFRRFLCHRAR